MIDALIGARLVKSKSDARRLIQQGGAYVNEQRVDSIECTLTATDVQEGQIILRAGKKKYGLVVVL